MSDIRGWLAVPVLVDLSLLQNMRKTVTNDHGVPVAAFFSVRANVFSFKVRVPARLRYVSHTEGPTRRYTRSRLSSR